MDGEILQRIEAAYREGFCNGVEYCSSQGISPSMIDGFWEEVLVIDGFWNKSKAKAGLNKDSEDERKPVQESEPPASEKTFVLKQTVIVSMLDGSKRSGRVFGFEPGENVRPPVKGVMYIVEFTDVANSRLWKRFVVVGQDRLEASG